MKPDTLHKLTGGKNMKKVLFVILSMMLLYYALTDRQIITKK